MRRCGALAALAVAALAPCAALEPAAALSAAAGADALTPPALPAGCGGRAECEPERWLREQQALNTVIVALLALTGGAVLVIAIVRFACCPVARPTTQPPRAARGSRPPLELLPLRRVDSWQVGPAVLTELPDGTMVAALPRSAKTGALRGRSFWGSGGARGLTRWRACARTGLAPGGTKRRQEPQPAPRPLRPDGPRSQKLCCAFDDRSATRGSFAAASSGLASGALRSRLVFTPSTPASALVESAGAEGASEAHSLVAHELRAGLEGAHAARVRELAHRARLRRHALGLRGPDEAVAAAKLHLAVRQRRSAQRRGALQREVVRAGGVAAARAADALFRQA